MDGKIKNLKREVPPRVLEQLKKTLGYKEETILTLLQEKNQMSDATFERLIKTDPVFSRAMLIEYLSKSETAAVSYFQKYDIDYRALIDLPEDEMMKRLNEM